MSFSAFGLLPPLLRALEERDHLEPTPVQQQAIPAILRGGDVWARAHTGSGKTAAYLLPVLHGLHERERKAPRNVRTLILVPTRELAAQVHEEVVSYTRHFERAPKACVVVGGVSITPQMMALRGGADVVIATPGRLLDLVEHNALSLLHLEVLVLDEADRLFSLGFAEELQRVLELLPHTQQNLLLSATFPPSVQELAKELLHDPTAIDVSQGTPHAPASLQTRAIEVDTKDRTRLLRHLAEAHAWPQVLVFVASRHGADHLALKLRCAGLPVATLHGGLSQGARTDALAEFKARGVRFLIATDVAARGLDIASLPAVVNYDLPRSASDYLHRIGRTGRAGASGVAVSFVTAENQAHFRLIERRHGLDTARERLPEFPIADVPPPVTDPSGGIKGRRKSKKDKLREAAARAQANEAEASPREE